MEVFSVSVSCSPQFMQVIAHFDGPFFGRLATQPNSSCFVEGRGRHQLSFRLSLDEGYRGKCAIIRVSYILRE